MYNGVYTAISYCINIRDGERCYCAVGVPASEIVTIDGTQHTVHGPLAFD